MIFCVLFMIPFFEVHAQEDDFEDGNDAVWTRIAPSGGLGAGPITTFSESNGTYRISTAVSPSPSAAGPALRNSRRLQQNHGSSFLLHRFI
jgi:hypothetical protein